MTRRSIRHSAWVMAGLAGCVLLAGCLPAPSPPAPTPTGAMPPTVTTTGPPALAPTITVTAPSAAGVPSFRRDILTMYAGKCSCHGREVGRFDPTSYAGTLLVIVPYDPEASQLVQMMRQGHHGKIVLSKKQLEVVIRWIQAGAPDN